MPQSPDNCDDFARDGADNVIDRNFHLSDLMASAWSDRDLTICRRYNNQYVDGVTYNGWAMWLANNPHASDPDGA